MNNYIKGEYKREIFSSNTGYLVGLFKVKETNNQDWEKYLNTTITFTGYFHELNNIDNYIFYGSFVEHEKYGMQFQTESYERSKPEEKDSIVEFLTSGLFKGIGEKKAKKIVDVLGKDTLKIILEQPNNLILIPGITEKNKIELHNKLQEYEASYEIIIKLGNLGFTTREAMIIYNFYKEKSLQKIDEDFYNLYYDLKNLSFKRIDMLAIKNNIPNSDITRIEAGIIYVMNELTNNYGHSYYFIHELLPFVEKALHLDLDKEKINTCLDNLIKKGLVVKKDDYYYLTTIYNDEVYIVNRLNLLMHEKDNLVRNIDEYIKKIEEHLILTYNDDQKEAIKESMKKNLLVITGGPGTGKTTILKGICELYKQINKYTMDKVVENVALLAPTGRAAKRMSEETSMPASTIHRFLKWNKDNNSFQINEYNRCKKDLVIIDEASMIDVNLFASLLRGLSVHTRIIIVGDVDQLPSVGPGQVLYDLIDSNKINVKQLNTLYRQKEQSNIIKLAYNIKEGILDTSIFNKEEDLTFIECSNDDILKKIEEISYTYLDYSYKNFQILAPMYKTLNGIDNINNKLQTTFNKKSAKKKEILVNEELYREGDKVIQLTNMPDENVYNGDIGIIDRIVNSTKKEIYIDFEGNIVKYTQANFINFKKAYAISIHKSQGSEFDIVIIPIVKNFQKMLYRKLIYTAVTRCKTRLYLIGDLTALDFSIKNNNSLIRRTTIKKFLVDGIN